jgi:hypothetical protein
LLVPLTSVFTIPFIPDLIQEESQPLGIFFNVVSAACGKVVVAGLMDVVADKSYGVSFTIVYIGVGCLAAFYTVYAFFGMKDVV